MMSMGERIFKTLGKGVFRKSSIRDISKHPFQVDPSMPYLLGENRYKSILEIGTCRGVSAAVLSEYADSVTTIDLKGNKYDVEGIMTLERLWSELGITNIKKIQVKNDIEKIGIIESLDFDMAFVDGNHGYPMLLDWLLVKRCKNVLFHDYGGNHINDPNDIKYCPVKDLVDTLPKDEIMIKGLFAFWNEK